MKLINPCSACSVRKLNSKDFSQCCFDTCLQFRDKDTCKEECGKCANYAIENLTPKPIPFYSQCLNSSNQDSVYALSCCIKKCDSNECQEQCINAYNAELNVKENFFLDTFLTRNFLVVTLLYLVHILFIYNIVPYANPVPLQLVVIYISIYLLVKILY